MQKKLMIRVVSGLFLIQSTAIAAGVGSASEVMSVDSAAACPMVSVMRPVDETLNAVYPQTYRAHDKFNLPEEIEKIARGFNMLSIKFPVRTAAQRADLGKIIIWYADIGLAYLDSLPASSFKTTFMEQLEAKKKAPFEDVNRYFVKHTVLRSLALASKDRVVDPEIEDVFKHLRAKLLFALHEKVDGVPAWQHSDLAIIGLATDKDTPSEKARNVRYNLLPDAARALFKAEKRKLFSKKMYVPVAGADKFGLTMLVRSWLANIYPIAMPVEKDGAAASAKPAGHAHGYDLPADYFAWHDKVHSDQDRRQKSSLEWAEKVHQEIILNGSDYDFRKTIPEVVAMAKHRLDLINLIFGNLLDHAAEACATKLKAATNDAEQKLVKQEYNRTLAPIFYMLHEAAGAFDAGLFDRKTPLEMLDHMIKHSLSIAKEEIDECKNPVFVNFSGKRVKTDAEIRAWVEASKIFPGYSGPAAGIEVTKTPAYINIKAVDRYGTEHKVAVPHRSVQLKILEDDTALLRLAGIAVAPVMGEPGTDEFEITAQNHVRSIDTGVQTLLQGLLTKYITDVHASLSTNPVVQAVLADNVKLVTYRYSFGNTSSTGNTSAAASGGASAVASAVTTSTVTTSTVIPAVSSAASAGTGGPSSSAASTGSAGTGSIPSAAAPAGASVVAAAPAVPGTTGETA